MRVYEGLFILVPEASVEARKSQLESIEDLIKKNKGTIRNKAEWGRKTVGYPLKKHRDGFYVIYDFEVETSVVGEIDRVLRLDENILKFMITIKNMRVPKPKKKKEKKAAAVKPETAAVS
jgi:small subunit ribosomal protein S6